MMYSNHFAAAVKVGGKVLREDGDTVYLPFGSEYSVLLKNISARRAQAKVSIDGADATEGTWLVLGPNQSLELERFIRNGNLNRGNRFKFIERTDAIEEHRGIKADDGLIRIEYRFERETVPIPRYPYTDTWLAAYPPQILNSYQPTWTTGTVFGGSNFSFQAQCYNSAPTGASGLLRSANLTNSSAEISETSVSRAPNDAGITVAGSESNQQFRSVSGFETEASRVIVLRLKGRGREKAVEAAITVDRKPICGSCGRRNKPTSKFCTDCGTALELFS